MAEPFLGQIRQIGFDFAPRGWALCDGQILPISQNQSLYSLLGTTYGGDGRTSFALPDLRGRVSFGFGQGPGQTNRPLGSEGGEETHILTAGEIPDHTHTASASAQTAQEDDPDGNVWASSGAASGYASGGDGQMGATAVSTAGGQAHENMQPSLAINYIIALQGVFPSRN